MISCVSPSTNPVIITNQDQEILSKLKIISWVQAYTKQDTALLNELLHEKYLLTDDNGDRYTKKDEMEYVTDYGPSYDEFNFKISTLDIFENGTAIIIGEGILKGIEGNETYITKYQSSNTFIKIDGKWKAINSHVSGTKEERFPMSAIN